MANRIKIKTEALKAYGLPDDPDDGVEVMEDKIRGNSRWSIEHSLVFKWADGKFYRTSYRVGATEMQHEGPWEYEDEVECTEVHLIPQIIDVWVAVE